MFHIIPCQYNIFLYNIYWFNHENYKIFLDRLDFQLNAFDRLISNPTKIGILIVFLFSWYIYVSTSNLFDNLVIIFNTMIINFYDEFLNPNATEGMAILLVETSSHLNMILKYFYLVSQLLIIIGLIATVLCIIFSDLSKKYIPLRINEFNLAYMIIAVTCLVVLIAAIIVPYFSGNIGTVRLFHITLIILSPFFVIGSIVSLTIFSLPFKHFSAKRVSKLSCTLVSFFLFIFLLMNSGVFHEVSKDKNPISISISSDKEYLKSSSIFTEKEVRCAKHLSRTIGDKFVFTDIFGRQFLRLIFIPRIK